jgi:predicted glutamine amidotransferase
MCRFLIANSNNLINPKDLLNTFSTLAQASRTIDGDMQNNGWGMAWLDDENQWQIYKSMKPVWEDTAVFESFIPTKTLLVHARSASYSKFIDDVSVNQPYFNNKFSFVFNGDLSGVKIDKPVPGKIGAQKLWYLLQQNLLNESPYNALQSFTQFMRQNTSKIWGMNIGFTDGHKIYASCNYTPNNVYPDYHMMHCLCTRCTS